MKPLFVICAMLITSSLPAQPPSKGRELREQLHRKMLESAFFGQESDLAMQDLERMMDGMMEEVRQEMQALHDQSPRGFGSSTNSFFRGSRSFSSSWSETTEGRTLKVIPADKNTKLDVEVKEGVVMLKSEFSQTGGGAGVSGMAQQTFTVPDDCDGDRVKIEGKDGGLSLFFPFRGQAPERRPLKGKPQDIQT